MNKLFKTGIVVSALTLVAAATSCGEIKRGEYAKGTDTIYCDDGFKNVLEEEIEVFEYTYRDADILPRYVSEGQALDALLGDTTSTVIVTHELTDGQIKDLKKKYKRVVKQQEIAVDAVAIIVNKDNPVEMLSVEEVGKIMRGEVTKWNQLALNDTTDIKIVFDNANSSTAMYMRERFLDGKPITDNPNVKVFAENNNREVFDVIKKDPNAIGIISVSWLGDSLEMAKRVPLEDRVEKYNVENETIMLDKKLTTEVKVVPIQNPIPENDYTLVPYLPYQENIFKMYEYPFVRHIYMVTTASSGTMMKSFYDFVTGKIGQKIMMNTGILPARIHPRIVELK